MAKPILEQILTKMVAALEAITVANGYQVTVNSVYRPKSLGGRDRTSPASYDVQLTLGDETTDDDLSMMGNPPIVGLAQPVQLDLIYRPSDAAATAIEEVLNTFRADVTRALMADPQWEGYAIDTEMGNPSFWVDEASRECGVTEVATLRYRVKENDPFTRWYSPPGFTAIVDGGGPTTEDYDAILEGNGS